MNCRVPGFFFLPGTTPTAFGRRIEATGNGQTTYDLYGASDGGHPIAEYAGGGWYREAIMEGVRWGWLYQNGDGRYTLPDALGSTAVLAQDGTVEASRLYPFGEEAQATGAEYKSTNQIRDGKGLDHFAFRTYSSNLARWLSPDPAGLAAVSPADPQSWNRYAYVRNQPLSAIDPLGLACPAGGCSSIEGPSFIENWEAGRAATLSGLGRCTVNGIDQPCRIAEELVAEGVGTACPDNDCTGLNYPFNGYKELYRTVAHRELVLNCVGEDTSNDSCFWSHYSQQFVVNGADGYFVGDGAALFTLGMVGEESGFVRDPRFIAGWYAGSLVLGALPEASAAAKGVDPELVSNVGDFLTDLVPGAPLPLEPSYGHLAAAFVQLWEAWGCPGYQRLCQ